MLPVHKAQQQLPKLCRSGKAYLITNRDQPSAVLLSIDDYEAIMESMDILSNPKAMRVLRAASAGKLKYKRLNLTDENFGL
jgi:prevent-host-death family protein